MAAEQFLGTQGFITLPVTSFIANSLVALRRWTLNLVSDMVDVTAWNIVSNSRDFLQGPHTWSGDFEGFMDNTTAQGIVLTDFQKAAGAAVSGFVLAAAATDREFTGSGHVNGMTIGAAMGEAVTVSGTFQGSGAIALDWTTGA